MKNRVVRIAALLLLATAPPRTWGGVHTRGGRSAVFNVRDYGARGDGVHLDTAHIQAAIDAAVAAGGGTVLLPAVAAPTTATATTYLSSGITLGSNVYFRVEQGAVLGSSRRWADYPKVRETDSETAKIAGLRLPSSPPHRRCSFLSLLVSGVASVRSN